MREGGELQASYTNFRIICSSLVKNALGILIGIASKLCYFLCKNKKFNILILNRTLKNQDDINK